MREEGIRARPRRPFRPRTTEQDKAAVASPNLLSHSEPPNAPGQQIVSDITYIRTGEGWLYLVIVLDLYSRAIVGWDLSCSLEADGVSRAVKRAIKSGYVRPEAIFHSDRGWPIHQQGRTRGPCRPRAATKHERTWLLL
jgi:putative transposase